MSRSSCGLHLWKYFYVNICVLAALMLYEHIQITSLSVSDSFLVMWCSAPQNLQWPQDIQSVGPYIPG